MRGPSTILRGTPSRPLPGGAVGRVGLCVLTLAGILTAPTPAAGAAVCHPPRLAHHGMELGVQDDSVFVSQGWYDRMTAFRQLRALHATTLRMNLIWSDFKRYGWSPWDGAVRAAAANGVRVQLTIAGTPQYDPGGNQYISFRHASPGRVAQFMKLVARHFKGCVTRYSVWNEPNLPRWLSPSRNAPRIYRNLYRRSYAAIKSVDRRDQVLIGELTSAHNPMGFLSRAARGLRADGLAYHPFQFYAAPGRPDRGRGFVGISKTGVVRYWLRRLRRAHRLRTPHGGTPPIYFTEFGYLTRGYYRMSEGKRRSWAVRALRLARRQGARQMVWYMLVHPPAWTLHGDIWDSAIVRLSGRPDSTYSALRRARRSIAGF